MTSNNTVTKTDVQLVVCCYKEERVFLELSEAIALALTEIFCHGVCYRHFYYLSPRIESLGFDLIAIFVFNVLIFSSSKFYRSQHHDKITEHENISISQIEIFTMVVSLFHEFIKSFCIITSRQLRKKKSKKKVEIHLRSSGFLGKFNQNRFQSSNIYIK